MLGIVYILWTYSILEYFWSILNILGIFPQYSGLVSLFLFTVSVAGDLGHICWTSELFQTQLGKPDMSWMWVLAKCWESNSIGARGTARKDWLTPMSSFDVEQGGQQLWTWWLQSSSGGTDGPGFSLCAVPLELSGPGLRSMEQRLREQAEVWRYTGPEMLERTWEGGEELRRWN